jgi:hypothetical protein
MNGHTISTASTGMAASGDDQSDATVGVEQLAVTAALLRVKSQTLSSNQALWEPCVVIHRHRTAPGRARQRQVMFSSSEDYERGASRGHTELLDLPFQEVVKTNVTTTIHPRLSERGLRQGVHRPDRSSSGGTGCGSLF